MTKNEYHEIYGVKKVCIACLFNAEHEAPLQGPELPINMTIDEDDKWNQMVMAASTRDVYESTSHRMGLPYGV